MSKYGDYRICFSNDLSDPKNQVTIIGDKEPLSQFQEKMDEWRGAKKKADECEAKAKAFDEIREARKEILVDVHERGFNIPADQDKFTLQSENIINKYESGESND